MCCRLPHTLPLRTVLHGDWLGPPGVFDVALVAQDGGEVPRQLLLTEGLQEATCRLEAGPLAHQYTTRDVPSSLLCRVLYHCLHQEGSR